MSLHCIRFQPYVEGRFSIGVWHALTTFGGRHRCSKYTVNYLANITRPHSDWGHPSPVTIIHLTITYVGEVCRLFFKELNVAFRFEGTMRVELIIVILQITVLADSPSAHTVQIALHELLFFYLDCIRLASKTLSISCHLQFFIASHQ